MSVKHIEDLRLSSSSIDDFFSPVPGPTSRQASAGKVRIANLMQLADFHSIGEDKLVHYAKKDFWRLGKDDEGFFIERLVNDDEGPVKY